MVVERKPLTGKLNVDASHKTLPREDYQNALNVRVWHGLGGDVAVVKNVPGTRTVTTGLISDTADRVRGTYEDTANRRIFYFIYGPDEGIYVYRRDEDDIKAVLLGSDVSDSLNFQDEYITGITLIGDKLYWTEPGTTNQPRMINVERGITAYDGSYIPPSGTAVDPYSLPLDEEDITIIRRQPVYPLQIQKITTSEVMMLPSQDNNFIERVAFQFSYYYEYTDGEHSTLGPWSAIAPYNLDSEDYDGIEVTIPEEEDVRSEIKNIRVVVRSSADVAVNDNNNWRVIQSWRRSVDGTEMDQHNSGTLLSFYFYNNFLGNALQEAEALKPFDSVPIYSNALEGARDRIFLGNNIEGYDPVTGIDLTASITSQTDGAGLTAEYILVHVECDDSGITLTTMQYW